MGSIRLVSASLILTAAVATLAFRPAPLPPTGGVPAQDPVYPQPGAEHKLLLAGVGEWVGTLEVFMPGAPKGAIAVTESVIPIGGFWTQSRLECEFGGAPYVGTGVVGYDQTKKKYVGTWVDSSTSELAVTEGSRDPKTKALTMSWVATDPQTGKPMAQRFVLQRSSDGLSYTQTFYAGPGKGTRSMVIKMKRKKKAAKPAPTGKDK